jgi:hypothetical protein
MNDAALMALQKHKQRLLMEQKETRVASRQRGILLWQNLCNIKIAGNKATNACSGEKIAVVHLSSKTLFNLALKEFRH